jgi:hypothetical protein
MNKLFGFFLLLSMFFTLTGCGDLFGKKVVEKKLENGRLKADCELDMDEFKYILDRPITGAINCLEKNLKIFMDVSELGRGGKLSRKSLLNYLKRNRPDTDEKTISIINTVFALSNLITGGEKDVITKNNVTAIIQLVRTFNLHAYRHYNNTFGSKDPANLYVHESHRTRVEAAAVELQKALQSIYIADRKGEIHFVEIMDIVKGFVIDDPEKLEKIEGMLFAKKILTGGDIKTINHIELGFVIDHLPKLLSLVLDAVRYQYLEIEQRDTMKFMQDDLIDLANILFHPSRGDRRYEGLFDVDAVITGIDRFIKKDEEKIGKYRALLKEGVRIFTKTKNESAILTENDEQWVLGKDLEKIISHGFNITSRALAFHRIYNSPNLKPMLDSPQSVYIDPKKYELEFPLDKVNLKEFARIINTYRYMKGSFNMTYYSLDYRRNAAGTAEISTYEYLIRTAFGYYGSSLSMGADQLKGILKKFENELIEMDIILPRRTTSTSETISLLGSLFQAQSDDNKVLDVDEAAEFAISLVTAMDAKSKLFNFYEDKNCQRDEFNRLDASCFKEHFFEAICTNYRDNFPRLFEFLGTNNELKCNEQNFNSEHNLNYLNASAQAARFCHLYPDDNTEIKYSEGDIMSILLAMMHIETTITRWDTNQNNTMDSNEVMDAYAIYKPAINGMLPKLPSVLDTPKIRETLAKQVYLYLVKFEEVPKTKKGQDIWKLVKFLLSFNGKKAPAHRKTIASILRIVSEEGRRKAEEAYQANPNDPSIEKPFDCNWLRDPNNIPRD